MLSSPQSAILHASRLHSSLRLSLGCNFSPLIIAQCSSILRAVLPHEQNTGQFGAGPHSCLGAPLYAAEAKVLLSLITRHYELSLVSSRTLHPVTSF